MSTLAIRLYPETVRTVSAAQILAGGGDYIPIGTIPASSGPTNNQYSLLNASRILFIEDTTDQPLMYSFDGVNDHFALANNSFLLLDIGTNKTAIGGALTIAQGTVVYVRYLSVAPKLGDVFLSSFYGQGG